MVYHAVIPCTLRFCYVMRLNWMHAEYRGWETACSYKCDFCLKKCPLKEGKSYNSKAQARFLQYNCNVIYIVLCDIVLPAIILLKF